MSVEWASDLKKAHLITKWAGFLNIVLVLSMCLSSWILLTYVFRFGLKFWALSNATDFVSRMSFGLKKSSFNTSNPMSGISQFYIVLVLSRCLSKLNISCLFIYRFHCMWSGLSISIPPENQWHFGQFLWDSQVYNVASFNAIAGIHAHNDLWSINLFAAGQFKYKAGGGNF